MAYKKARNDNEGEKGKRYEDIARGVASGLKSREEQNMAMDILSTDKAREAYELLNKGGVPENTIKRIMKHGLESFQSGEDLTVGSYAMGVAEELAHLERYGRVIDNMYHEKIIDKGQYESVKGAIGKHTRGHVRNLSRLEKLAASVFGVAGLGIIIASGMKITGNTIGNPGANAFGTVAGIVLLVLSLALFWRSFKN